MFLIELAGLFIISPLIVFIIVSIIKAQKDKPKTRKTDVWYCDNCGTVNSADAEKCVDCGAKHTKITISTYTPKQSFVNSPLFGVLIIVAVSAVIIGGIVYKQTKPSTNNIEAPAAEEAEEGYSIASGELLEAYENGSTISFKVKITPSYSGEATILQNYVNMYSLAHSGKLDGFDFIVYNAVAETDKGTVETMMSYTMDKDTVSKIKSGTIVERDMKDYVKDIYVSPVLINTAVQQGN